MNNYTDPLGRIVNTVRIYLKTWPQLLPLRQPIAAERPSRDFVAPVFISVVIHMFLAFLLWDMVTSRTAVKPEATAIDNPLIVTLSTFTDTSRDGIDLEVVTAVPHTEPPAQESQSSPEPSNSTERKSEPETVVTSKDRGVQGSEAPEEKSPQTHATPSFDLEAAYRLTKDFGVMPEFEAETAAISKGRGIPGSESREGKFPTACLTASYDLENFYCIEQEFGRMSESEIMDMKIKTRKLYIKNYLAEARALHPDCRTVYMGNGLLAIPLFIHDVITGNGCKWWPDVKEVKGIE